MSPRTLKTLITLVAVLAFGTALADHPRLMVVMPHEDPVSGDHAEAAASNPSGLSFGEDFEMSYTYVTGNPQRLGEGHAFVLSTTFGDSYSMGLGYEKLNPPGKQDSLPSRWSWAHSFRISPIFSMGVTWHSHSGAALAPYDDFSTVSAGAQVRPWRWLAAGVLGQNLNRPDIDGEKIERNWLAGLSIRPGTERVSLTGFAEIDEAGGDVGYGARMTTQLYGGFSFVGRYDTRDSDDGRVHQLMVGFSSQFGPNAGIFYYGPNLSNKDGQSGIAINLRTGRDGESKTDRSERPTLARVNITDTSEYGVEGFFSPTATAPFLQLLRTLDSLSRNADVNGVVLSFQTTNMGWAQASELREAIQTLRAAGKTVYAWLPYGDTRTYAAACAADRILTTHAGGIMLTGVTGGTMHIKGLLDKFGVNAEFVATGDYKTFPEMFTKDGPSDASTETQNAIVGQLYDDIVAQIAQGREKTPDEVKALIDKGPYTAKRAKDAGLVDKVIHYDEFEDLMKKQFGDRAELVNASDLVEEQRSRWGSPSKVGVVYIVGTITDGASSHSPLFGSGTTGSSTTVRAIEDLRRDKDIEAVVIRVDSPGGSVTAADAIWRAVSRLGEKKPVIVSMGDVAASGGYYVAAPAKKIMVSDSTITGSIGVFTGKYDLSGLYGKIGVNKAPVSRGARANLMTDARPWNEDERAAVQRGINDMYSVFLERVLSGRESLTLDSLKTIAGGRVWTGRQARERGLADESKGFLGAITEAAKAADLDPGNIEIEIRPKMERGLNLPSTPFGQLLGRLGVSHQQAVLPPLFAGLSALWDSGVLNFANGTPLAILPWVFH